MKNICFILGTRPEIIKLSPIIRLCQSKNIPFTLIHTNQHFSSNMDAMFFEELKLPQPTYNLNIRESLHGKMVGKMLEKIEEILLEVKPDIVMVEGDTNTVLAGSLAAAKLHILVGHVEAGLRSYDRSMPEEINRVMTDHISTFLFCPTKKQEEILKGEGIVGEHVVVTGNTIVDAVMHNVELAQQQEKYSRYMNEEFLLLTLHRPANVDNKAVLQEIIDGVIEVSKTVHVPVYFPVHPRTQKALEQANITLSPEYFHVLEPASFLEMLMLEKHAKLIMTDSGGVQEEACILHVPCVTIRNNTERPETVDVGGNMLAGTSKNGIVEAAKTMIRASRTWDNPLGDGNAAQKILDHCL